VKGAGAGSAAGGVRCPLSQQGQNTPVRNIATCIVSQRLQVFNHCTWSEHSVPDEVRLWGDPQIRPPL